MNGWKREEGLLVEMVAGKRIELAAWLRQVWKWVKRDVSHEIQQKQSPTILWRILISTL